MPDSLMTVFPVRAFTDNYIWTIIDHNTDKFDCVDPGDAQPVLDFAREKKLQLRSILLTHHHNDHIGGVQELLRHFPQVQVYAPEDKRFPYVTHTVTAEEKLSVGSCRWRVLFNPGHTISHVSYYETQQHWLFCGDTLFSAGCGRVFDGTMEQLHHSMQLFKSLPADTQVFCGHEYTLNNLRFAHAVEPGNKQVSEAIKAIEQQTAALTLPSNMQRELAINPFLRTDKPEVIAFAQQHGASSDSSLDVFTVLRNEKNLF